MSNHWLNTTRTHYRCNQCGELYDRSVYPRPYCEACGNAMGMPPVSAPLTPDLPGWTLDDKNAKARELGLSYGRFQALVHDGTLVMTDRDKPKKLNANGSFARRHAFLTGRKS